VTNFPDQIKGFAVGVEQLKLREGFYAIDGDCNPSAFVLGFFDSYYFPVTAH
jgi:hypothetical protein